jgi:hypothetical protein
MVDTGLEETAVLGVVELRQHDLCQAGRLTEPAQVKGRFVEGQQPADQRRVVLQVGIEPRPPILVGTQQAAVGLAHLLENKVSRFSRRLQGIGAA